MFYQCSNITEINLSHFNTSNITSMYCMFDGCSSMTSIDLSNIDTSQVTHIAGMFYNCQSLTSLNLSFFNTSFVQHMHNMLYNCLSLTSLDLSNFDTSQLIDLDRMFSNCYNLEYINLKNFVEIKIGNAPDYYYNMFNNIPINVVICINESITKEKIFPQIKNKTCYVIDCADNWKSNKLKIINDTNKCIENCENSSLYHYEYNDKYYEKCQQGFLYDNNNIQTDKCKCQLDECLICPNVSLNKGLCTKCNNNYYPKENDPLNIGEYIKCYQELEGYYLDNNIYKQCYHTCKICNISGNNITHNCIKCSDYYPIQINRNNYLNCEKCNFYYYFDNENNYHCTENLTCPKEYHKLNEDEMECFKNDFKHLMKDLETYEQNKRPKMPKEEETEYYNNIIKIIEKSYTDHYDTSKLDNGEDEIIKTEKINVTLTTLQNQKNNINQNMTTIDFGTCENSLRNYYNITNNQTIYMKKYDFFQEGYSIPKVEFDVYSKLSETNLIKLNLTVCNNSKIKISIPIELTENIDKLNPKSDYYNDICYTTSSEYNTDITLKDR